MRTTAVIPKGVKNPKSSVSGAATGDLPFRATPGDSKQPGPDDQARAVREIRSLRSVEYR
jgi:hypothetical protein